MLPKSTINRRQFFTKAAGLAAGAIAFPYVVPSSALGKAGTIAPSNRIVMGAIGVGGQGRHDLRSFLDKKEVRMLAICDVDGTNRKRAEKLINEKYDNNDCTLYRDFRELIGRGDLDAVMLALPDHWHGIISVAAANAGLDIHGQKPLARTIREGRAIVEAVRRNGVIWQTGSQQRSSERFRRACERVRNGRLGKIHKVEVGLPNGRIFRGGFGLPTPEDLDWDMWLGPASWRPYHAFDARRPDLRCHWNWRWLMDFSGGQLTDWAGHHIDIAHWGLGLDRTGPVEIEGKGLYSKDKDVITDVPIEYKFTCKYANGLEMIVANNSQLPHGQGTVWYGDRGWIYVKRSRLRSDPSSILNEPVGPNDIRLYQSRDHKQNFLDCVKTRRPTVAPAEVAHRSISVALLGEIAMLTGRKLKWDPEKETFIGDPEANKMLSRPMRSPWRL